METTHCVSCLPAAAEAHCSEMKPVITQTSYRNAGRSSGRQISQVWQDSTRMNS